MSLQALGPLYAALRLGATLPYHVQSWRARRPLVWTLALALTDIAGPLFVLGYARPHLRAAIGGWWVVLFLLALPVEALRIRSLSQDDEADGIYSAVLWPWAMIGVVPVLGAGFFLFFDVLFPGQWAFGGGVGG